MKHLTYILIFIVAVSCNNNSIKKPKKPDNLIKKEVMTKILYDMSMFTAAKGVNKKLIENKGILPEDYIYKKYNIDSTQFAKSNEYYAYHLETYEAIFGEVKKRLEEENVYYDSLIDAEARINSEKSKAKREKRDSLNKTRKLEKGKELKRPTPSPLKKTDSLE